MLRSTFCRENMKKHIGKLIGILGILLIAFAMPIGRELTLLIKGKPLGPMISVTGPFDYCKSWIVVVVVTGAILTLAGISMEIASGIKTSRKK
jgi:hypothetical protein